MKKYLILAACLLGCTSVYAVSITGTLQLAGETTLNTESLANATSVIEWNRVLVTANGVTPGSILDMTINPGMPVTMSAPWTFGSGKAVLWQVGGFSYNLASSTIVYQDADFLTVTGLGVITGNGYDATQATWRFSTQGPGDSKNFSFSASAASLANNVPDAGSSAILLGIGLTGLMFFRRKSQLIAAA
jgi:hypothetical protein